MAPSTTLRRLLKEVSELSPGTASPNPTFHAAPLSDSDLHEWHFTLLGPPEPSPYAGGLYHGRISLPSQYPLKPPNFRFLTPSGRFEVNREICLSISGFHEETWMPAWGIRTALTALRSFMAEKGTAGQVGGLESNDEVRKRLAGESKMWRCGDCGKTNEEIMRGWWAHCKESGIKVDEKGGMELEAVPEGFEMRDKGKGKEVEKKIDETGSVANVPTIGTLPTQDAVTRNSAPTMEPSSQTVSTSQSQSLPKASPHDQSRPQTMSPNAALTQQSQPQSQLQAQISNQTTAPSTSFPRPTPTTNPASSQSQLQPPPPQPQQQETITLDRAITAVFLALCLMIIKKIFFPASTTAFGADELGMVREY